jgi:hypothetical protein
MTFSTAGFNSSSLKGITFFSFVGQASVLASHFAAVLGIAMQYLYIKKGALSSSNERKGVGRKCV